jgi:hypothetical protein
MANENDPLEGMTLGEMRRLRTRLFEKLIAEPITDPGFRRPYEKLHQIVVTSAEFIQRLKGLVWAGHGLCDLLTKSGGLLRTEDQFVNGLRSVAFHVSSLETDIADMVKEMNMPDAERLLHDQRREFEADLQRQAIQLVALWTQFPSLGTMHDISVRISQLMAAQLWAFLERATARVAAGTDQVFHGEGMPEGVADLFSDAFDKALESAEVVNITPVFKIIGAMLGFIQRKEKYEEDQEQTWAKFEMNAFLGSYFNWWTDGDGEQTIDGLVRECEQRFEANKKAVGEYFSTFHDAALQLDEFRRILRDYSGSAVA